MALIAPTALSALMAPTALPFRKNVDVHDGRLTKEGERERALSAIAVGPRQSAA